MNSWNDVMQNQKAFMLKKFLYQTLENKIANYEDLISRISFHLVTDNDMKLFAEMVNDLVMAGYFKAIEEYKKQLGQMGIEVNLKNDQEEKLGW